MEFIEIRDRCRPEMILTMKGLKLTRELIEVLKFHQRSASRNKSMLIAADILAQWDKLRVELNKPRVPVISKVRRFFATRI